MAITQERMLALIAAGQFYQRELRRLKEELKNAAGERDEEKRMQVFQEVSMAAYEHEPLEHAETLIREEAHFKFAKRRNEWARDRQAAKRSGDTGPEKKYRQKKPPKTGFTRQQNYEAPRLGSGLPAMYTRGHKNSQPVFEPGYDPNFVPAMGFKKTSKGDDK